MMRTLQGLLISSLVFLRGLYLEKLPGDLTYRERDQRKVNGTWRVMAVFLLLFLGFTGVLGGYELIRNTTEEALQSPLNLLNISRVSFKSYGIPGLLLLGNGFFGFLNAGATLYRIKEYTSLILIQGSFLMVGLAAGLIFNMEFFLPHTHVTYYVVGIILVLTGLKLNRG